MVAAFNKRAGDEFLAKNRTRQGVETLASGLRQQGVFDAESGINLTIPDAAE